MENEISPMSELEYNNKLKEIEADYEKAKHKLYTEYAMSHVVYKKGDIIKDERWALKIDTISVAKMLGLPQPVYRGYELKKDLTPRKDGNRVSIYGSRNVELVKKAE